MLSVIICSADPADLLLVKENIGKTIGVQHEIIAVDNSDGKKGICEVYNEGVKQAKYDLLCLMHEDIEMITPDWGQKVIEIFQDPAIGLIGVAGGGYKSVVPSGWYNADLEINGAFYCNLIQGFKYSGRAEFLDSRNPKNEALSQVACIDGCWMCTKKEIALQYPFDERLLKHFHGYDVDFSIAVGRNYKVGVTYEVLLRHFSEGTFSQVWEEDTLKMHRKWSAVLPVNTDRLDEKTLLRNERRAFKKFFHRQLEKGASYSDLVKIIWDARHSRIFASSKWYKVYVDLWRVWKKERKGIRKRNSPFE